MPQASITDAFVRNVRPPDPSRGDKPQVSYFDTMERGLSLVLVVSYGGTKAFRALTYQNGKAKTFKLGVYPNMKLKAARELARDYYHNREKFVAQAAIGTFKDVAEDWFKRHVEAPGLRSQREIRRQLEKYVYPAWKDRKFDEIGRRDVNELLDDIADNRGLSQANAVLATIRQIMGRFETRDDHYKSPITKGMRRSKPAARARILDDDEIRELWAACTDRGSFGALIKIALLTAQRREKVATMRWDDLSEGVWTIRAEKREKGNAGELKLPSMAIEIIEKQPHIAGNPYVFAGRGATAFNSFSQRKEELNEKLPNMERWIIHDLRRTARSLMSRAGVFPHIAERVLGHVIAGVEGVYDRHSYNAEKAQALKSLAALVSGIFNPPEKDNLVQLPTRKGATQMATPQPSFD